MGFGRALFGAVAVPVGLAGHDAQVSALSSPFTAAATFTNADPQEMQAIGTGLANMAQDPWGQGELLGSITAMVIGPKVFEMSFAGPSDLAVATTLRRFPRWRMNL
jgi:hypothetical protein